MGGVLFEEVYDIEAEAVTDRFEEVEADALLRAEDPV